MDFSVFLIHMKILDRESQMTPFNKVHEIYVTVQIMISSDQKILNNLIRKIDDFNCQDIWGETANTLAQFWAFFFY